MSAILSICIPTLNRSNLLEVFLENLQRQAKDHLHLIEIVVANNDSNDSTETVVKNSPLSIVYGKQPSTVGFTKNVLFATTELASAEYVWVVGDDDLILPGAIERILQSITAAPDVDYHYLNFGWIDFQQRTHVVRQQGGQPDDGYFKRLQCDATDWKLLARLEDLISLPSDNISAVFSGIFCFVTKRQFFIDAIDTLKPSDSLDGSSTEIGDCFPHALLTLPRLAGQPIAYIGQPCVMQGVSGWEWGGYAYKNMVFGTYQLFQWLESTPFAADAMQTLWDSYFNMAGRLFFRMIHLKGEHKGVDIVIKDAIPFSASNMIFWDAFMEESNMYFATEYDAAFLNDSLTPLITNNPSYRVGLWGVSGRGHRFVIDSPHIHSNLVWVTDINSRLHSIKLDGTELTISEPATIGDAQLDILVIATRKEYISDVKHAVSGQISPETIIISTEGVSQLHTSNAV